MQKGISFLRIVIVTTVAWVLVGVVLRLFFASLSLPIFLFIGLLAGLFLAILLAFTREDSVSVSAPGPDAAEPPLSDVPPRPLRPNVPPAESSFHTRS
jgi:hypothetical protein